MFQSVKIRMETQFRPDLIDRNVGTRPVVVTGVALAIRATDPGHALTGVDADGHFGVSMTPMADCCGSSERLIRMQKRDEVQRAHTALVNPLTENPSYLATWASIALLAMAHAELDCGSPQMASWWLQRVAILSRCRMAPLWLALDIADGCAEWAGYLAAQGHDYWAQFWLGMEWLIRARAWHREWERLGVRAGERVGLEDLRDTGTAGSGAAGITAALRADFAPGIGHLLPARAGDHGLESLQGDWRHGARGAPDRCGQPTRSGVSEDRGLLS